MNPNENGELPALYGIMATVGSVSSSGVTLIFPGELTPSAKPYKRLAGVSLSTGDKVLAVKMAGTYVILNKLI